MLRNDKKEETEEEKERKKRELTEKAYIERTGDLLDSYRYYRNYLPRNPYKAYVIKKKCIEFGKELLPSFIDPDETDEEQIKINKEKQNKIDTLYKKACGALKTEIPHKRQIKYKYLDKGNRVYELKAGDADSCEVVKDELETIMSNFTDQQHEQHMGKLEEVDSEIFHVLTTGDNPVIKPVDPPVDIRIEDIVKLELDNIIKKEDWVKDEINELKGESNKKPRKKHKKEKKVKKDAK